MKTITQRELRSLFRYSPYSGIFYDAGTNNMRLGTRLNGYCAIKIKGKIYYAHRLAWLYMTGKWPKEIDHKNGERWDNRWTNLREVTRQQNCFNRKARGRFGKGVTFIGDRFKHKPYAAKIVLDNKAHHLGYFSTPEEARRAYKKASFQHHGAFGRCV